MQPALPLATLVLGTALGFAACATRTDATPGQDAGVGVSSSSGQVVGNTTGVGLPCDVDKVLADNCRQCHQDPTRYGAPMPLLSFEDLTADSLTEPGTPVFQLSRTRMRQEGSRMPPPPTAAVSDADLATFDAWIAAGTPRGTEACTSVVKPDPKPEALDCTPDVSLRPPTKFTMPQDESDLYVCYGVDLTPTEARHIFAMTPAVENTNILHHVLLFDSPTAFPSTPEPCSSGGSINWRLVYGWAPGGTSIVLPPEAGMPLSGDGADGTKHFVVQLHYNNVNHLAGQTDGSGFDLCSTTNLRPNEADVIAFGTTDIKLPPGSHRTYDCTFSVPAAIGGGIKFIAAMPHMHQLGSFISSQVERAGGAVESLGKVDDWNFQTQYWQPLSVDVKAGETVRTRCSWQNDSSSEVKFGEDTADEMCYSFSMYYPRIKNVPWAAPSYASQCTVTDE